MEIIMQSGPEINTENWRVISQRCSSTNKIRTVLVKATCAGDTLEENRNLEWRK
jgi:hypothetical protein